MSIFKPLLIVASLATGNQPLDRVPILETWRDDFRCMAITAYTEARGEGEFGMAVVVHTLMMRVATGFPRRSACDIAKRYYSGFANWPDQRPRNSVEDGIWLDAVETTWSTVLGNFDFGACAGATHYYNPAKAKPHWRKSMRELCVVGEHRFMAAR